MAEPAVRRARMVVSLAEAACLLAQGIPVAIANLLVPRNPETGEFDGDDFTAASSAAIERHHTDLRRVRAIVTDSAEAFARMVASYVNHPLSSEQQLYVQHLFVKTRAVGSLYKGTGFFGAPANQRIVNALKDTHNLPTLYRLIARAMGDVHRSTLTTNDFYHVQCSVSHAPLGARPNCQPHVDGAPADVMPEARALFQCMMTLGPLDPATMVHTGAYAGSHAFDMQLRRQALDDKGKDAIDSDFYPVHVETAHVTTLSGERVLLTEACPLVHAPATEDPFVGFVWREGQVHQRCMPTNEPAAFPAGDGRHATTITVVPLPRDHAARAQFVEDMAWLEREHGGVRTHSPLTEGRGALTRVGRGGVRKPTGMSGDVMRVYARKEEVLHHMGCDAETAQRIMRDVGHVIIVWDAEGGARAVATSCGRSEKKRGVEESTAMEAFVRRRT
jgi:hypothetical protein